MDSKLRRDLKKLLRTKIREKLKNYKPETKSKPFFDAFFSKKVVRLTSLVHSFYMTFGTSIYEQMAVQIARRAGFKCERQYELLGEIDEKTEHLIAQIHLSLQKGTKANKKAEVKRIRNSIKPSKRKKDPDSIVDVFLRKPSGEEYYFEITTVKPNKKEFIAMKKKLLRWVALRLSQNNRANVHSALVIPYNPYHPKPYKRWTAGKLYDKSEMFIGEKFWNFAANKPIYRDLLDVFAEVGKELRDEISNAVR